MIFMSTINPQKGEIWFVNFNPTKGSEVRKCRPAVVVSSNDVGKLPLKIVVPVTDWKPRYAEVAWFTHLTATKKNGLTKDSGADGFQVKSISVDRFLNKIGMVDEDNLEIILNTIALCIGI